jgi:hypothetical protein
MTILSPFAPYNPTPAGGDKIFMNLSGSRHLEKPSSRLRQLEEEDVLLVTNG